VSYAISNTHDREQRAEAGVGEERYRIAVSTDEVRGRGLLVLGAAQGVEEEIKCEGLQVS
jgi:hypothetical protein